MIIICTCMQISNTEGEDKENDGAGQNSENGSYNLNTIKTKSITICTMSINTLAELTFSVQNMHVQVSNLGPSE